ncbi:MAG: TIGR03986 family CRISPR-associated RAMP protein [Kineosporiaceae bacterium]
MPFEDRYEEEGYLSLRDKPVLTAVTTPEGVSDAIEVAGGFVNPYTFVPTPPRGDLVDGPGESGLGDSGPGGPPSHAIVSAGEWTGTLRVRLTTMTPLLLPDTERPVADPGHGHGHDPDGPKTFTTRLDPEQRPLLPGSSLKGALRSAFETVTASRFGVLSGHEGRLAYRIPATQGLDVVPAVVEDDGDGRRVFRLCRGDPDWRASGDTGNEVQDAAWVPAYRNQDQQLRIVGDLPGDLDDLHGRVVVARLRLYQYESRRRRLRFRVWRVTHVAPDRATLDAALASTAANDPEYPSGSLSLVPGAEARTDRGMLSITGHSIGNKHDERFFVYSDGDRRVPVEPGHVEFWRSVLDAYTAAKEYNTVPEGLAQSQHIARAAALADLPAGTPVYVTVDGATDAVTGVHPVMIGRMPFDRSPRSLLDASLRPAAAPGELSPADRLFGWVPSGTRDSARDPSGSSGYRGRLSFRSLTCTTEDWKADLPGEGVVLSPLSGPKPTQFRFYAARDKTGNPVPNRAAKETGYRDGGGLRGRKAYRWPVVPDAYWQPTTSKQNGATVPGTGLRREYLDPGASVSQTVRYRDWVRPGVTFVADLVLDAVPTAELGALLWLLTRGDTAPLRLGAGKPHGFGVVAADVDPDGTRLWNGDAVAQGWRQLTRPDPTALRDLRTLADEFEATASGHPVLAEALASYRAATAGVTGHPVHYPRETPEPVVESYKWFVANDRSTRREGVTQGWALPHVRDPEQRLPYLPDDPSDGGGRRGGPGQGGGPGRGGAGGRRPQQGPRPGPRGHGRGR